MKIFLVTLMVISFITTTAFAHGENKLGPNGGYLQMPGSFHTEVVPDSDGSFRVFLIDIQFKNPTVKNSKVILQIKKLKQIITFNCSPVNETYFHCIDNQSLKRQKMTGELRVKANRLGTDAPMAIYSLPLKLKI